MMRYGATDAEIRKFSAIETAMRIVEDTNIFKGRKHTKC
jgi:hypothetical protein